MYHVNIIILICSWHFIWNAYFKAKYSKVHIEIHFEYAERKESYRNLKLANINTALRLFTIYNLLLIKKQLH